MLYYPPSPTENPSKNHEPSFHPGCLLEPGADQASGLISKSPSTWSAPRTFLLEATNIFFISCGQVCMVFKTPHVVSPSNNL